jgi:hypothetical protein
MYLFIRKIEDIVNFEITALSIYMIEKKSNDIYNLIQNEKIILKFNFTSLTKGLSSNIVVSDNDNTIYVFDKNNIQDKLEGYSLSERAFSKNEIIISKRISKGLYEKFIYNLQTKIISEIKNIPIFIFDNNFLFSAENKIGLSKSISKLNYSWQANLEYYGEIRKILGVQKNKLWISIYRAGSNKDKNVLLALDILTGEVVYKSPPDYDLSDWFVEVIPECNSVISIYGKISSHGPADSPFVEINATTGETIRNQRIESLYEENLKIGQWKYFENKIYFTASKDTINSTHIGVLDYETLDLLWYTEVIDRKGGMRELQITKDKIYVLDQGNQLHIFEKE